MSWLSSIFRRNPEPVLWTGRVFSSSEFSAMLGAWEKPADDTYAEVKAASLPAYHSWFRSKLFDLGVTKWDRRYDCDNFASLYADFLQLRFYLGNWSPGVMPRADSLAVAAFWYRPKCGSAGHAINAVATDKGLLFVEPQNGEVLELTPEEIASRLRVIF